MKITTSEYQIIGQNTGIFGENQSISANYNVVGGGGSTAPEGNTVSGTHNGVFGRSHNVSSTFNLVGGWGNAVGGYQNLVSGYSNTVNTNQCIVGGQLNVVTGTNNIVMGDQIVISGNYSLAIGRLYTTSGACNITVGQVVNCGAGADYNFVHGLNSGVSAGVDFASAQGDRAVARNLGQHTYASGMFTTNGDAQTSVMVARGTTTDDTTPVRLKLDGSSTGIISEDNKSYMINADIVAKDTASQDSWYQKIVALVTRGTGAGSLLIDAQDDLGVSAGTLTITAATLGVDLTTGEIYIAATGQAATTVHWVSRIAMTEVGV